MLIVEDSYCHIEMQISNESVIPLFDFVAFFLMFIYLHILSLVVEPDERTLPERMGSC